jgi:hypothetical protein
MSRPAAAVGHMPFPGHRTQAEVRRDSEMVWCAPRGRAWCAQCEQRVSNAKAAMCQAPFCKAKALAA